MNIKYLGHSSFYLKTKEAKVVTDPFTSEIGLTMPKVEADIVTISHSHSDHNNLDAITGDYLTVDWPGDFEKQNVRIRGIAAFHDDQKGELRGANILYRIDAENMNILHCGDLGHVPTEAMLDSIGNVDILMIPVGGQYTLDPKQACQVIAKIEPSIIIPMHFGRPELKQETYGQLADIEAFLKEYGAVDAPRMDQLTIKKEDLTEERRVIVLTS